MKKIIKVIMQICRSVFRKEKKDPSKKAITLQQVKDAIASGKCKLIYYSETTLWWTDDPQDLVAATIIGKEFCTQRHNAEMKSPKFNREAKSKLKQLYNSFINAKNLPPLDFVGNPILETDDLGKWITGAEGSPQIFGRNGLDAFMKTHHKNCDGKSFVNWDEANFCIDGIPAITNVVKETPVRKLNPKVIPGRNEVCPCGSGKKYKHCHALITDHKTKDHE